MVQARSAMVVVAATLLLGSNLQPGPTRPLDWNDFPAPVQHRLAAAGLSAAAYPQFRDDHHQRTLARVHEGDLDALVYYALQSAAFTTAPPIEPALSAKALVEGLSDDARRQFLAGAPPAGSDVPAAARQRLLALLQALRNPPPHSRLAYFRDIVERAAPGESGRPAFVVAQYARAMRFLYEKEFSAARSGGPEAVATLYRERGLSTDTAVEAGYLVHIGLATLRALEPKRQLRRVLIVGPGLDLAPRTGLLEVGPPASYQPYAVVDSLLSLGLARLDDLQIVGADVNPRVVEHLESAGEGEVRLTLVTGIGSSGTVTLVDDYRRYFNQLGRSIGEVLAPPVLPGRYDGHLRKTVGVRTDVAGAISGVQLDVAAQRLDGARFDLIVITNVLPYLDDRQLTTALANLAGMLAPAGVLLHNEGRPLLAAVAADLQLPLRQARTASIARVLGAPPLSDVVYLHELAR